MAHGGECSACCKSRLGLLGLYPWPVSRGFLLHVPAPAEALVPEVLEWSNTGPEGQRSVWRQLRGCGSFSFPLRPGEVYITVWVDE